MSSFARRDSLDGSLALRQLLACQWLRGLPRRRDNRNVVRMLRSRRIAEMTQSDGLVNFPEDKLGADHGLGLTLGARRTVPQ